MSAAMCLPSCVFVCCIVVALKKQNKNDSILIFDLFFFSISFRWVSVGFWTIGRHSHSNGTHVGGGVGGVTGIGSGQTLPAPITSWNNLPLERSKSKFASLSRLFKPWKWRVRRKSDKLESVSQSMFVLICFNSPPPLSITSIALCDWFSLLGPNQRENACKPTGFFHFLGLNLNSNLVLFSQLSRGKCRWELIATNLYRKAFYCRIWLMRHLRRTHPTPSLQLPVRNWNVSLLFFCVSLCLSWTSGYPRDVFRFGACLSVSRKMSLSLSLLSFPTSYDNNLYFAQNPALVLFTERKRRAKAFRIILEFSWTYLLKNSLVISKCIGGNQVGCPPPLLSLSLFSLAAV